MTLLVFLACIIWLAVLLLPWRAWLNGETLEPSEFKAGQDLREVTVLIPARNEADVIGQTLQGLSAQGQGLQVVLVDDGSDDGTAEQARQAGQGLQLSIIESHALPAGWSGKLWALEQGAKQVQTPWVLLLDADIQLAPGLLAALLSHACNDRRQLVSIMAHLRMASFWERLLIPAFIYFFKLVYPFRLANSAYPKIAAAAGGCILLETRLLAELGGFACIRGEIIDDCNLAKQIKQRGYRTWIGQSHAVVSLRGYGQLAPIWDMVARTAFTQLHYSVGLLLLCTALLLLVFVVPVVGLLTGDGWVLAGSAVACLGMMASYWPTLIYYRCHPAWALALPIIGVLYLGMAWTSAGRYWRGVRSQWKNRVYTVGQ